MKIRTISGEVEMRGGKTLQLPKQLNEFLINYIDFFRTGIDSLRFSFYGGPGERINSNMLVYYLLTECTPDFSGYAELRLKDFKRLYDLCYTEHVQNVYKKMFPKMHMYIGDGEIVLSNAPCKNARSTWLKVGVFEDGFTNVSPRLLSKKYYSTLVK